MTNPKKLLTSAILSAYAVSMLQACATNPDKLSAASVSPLQYKSYDCEQVGLETARVERNLVTLHDRLTAEAKKDAWQAGVGIVLLWPVLFALEGGDGAEASEYRTLKGEYEALESVSIQKKCALTFEPLEKKFPTKTTNPEVRKNYPTSKPRTDHL